MKNIISIILVISLTFGGFGGVGNLFSQKVYATNTGKKTTIKIVPSEVSDFSIRVPDTWVNYISVETEKTNSKTGIVEKFNFYYKPKSSVNKPLLLMSLCVFNKSDWYNVNNVSYKKVTEDVNYVFAAVTASTNPYTNADDKTIFRRLTTEANDMTLLENMLVFENKIVSNETDSITVNGKMLKGKVRYIDNNIAYIPLREACDLLGYSVTWYQKERSVLVWKSASEHIRFYPDYPSKNSGYSIKIFDSVTYVNYSFFIWWTKANVEVDANRNIVIRKN